MTSTFASENLQVIVEISLVGFIIQSNGSELSDNVYFKVCISFIFHLKVYMTLNWFWSLGKFNQQFWTLKMCLPENFLNFELPKTAFCPSENLQVIVEISLVGFIIQSNGSELSDNVYFKVCISFIFHLKVYMTLNWFWSLGKFNQQFWTLKMCLPENFLNFELPKTAFCPSENLQVIVEISLVGFIIQSNGSELSDNVYFKVCISFIFHLKVYMTLNWFWSLGKFNQQFWTLKMCLPENFLNFELPKTAFCP